MIMSADSVKVLCGQCREVLDEDPHAKAEDRSPCPTCGSTARHFEVVASGEIKLRSKVSLKAKHGGRGKPFVEQVVGDDLHRKTGRWMKLRRVIDRIRNWYSEVVTDAETGAIVHKSEEALSDHQRHGSAKKRC
jgi:hypothetical protein